MRPTPRQIAAFRRTVLDRYRRHARPFPWRDYGAHDLAYRVLVSEVMLQQTQVARVAAKFPAFVGAFPTLAALARAPLSRVLGAWQGLGYNRRAKHLREAALRVVTDHGGELPRDPDLLAALPGIGRNTAAAICVYAFNLPFAFVETNIRTVFIHFFFARRRKVGDRAILALVESTMPRRDPRRWFNALMDYGAMLKEEHGNLSRRSAGHRPQPRFEGSDRQIRGRVLALLLERSRGTGAIVKALGLPPDRVGRMLRRLADEGLVARGGRGWRIA
jgi:A/G-specific adenine glycosylase